MKVLVTGINGFIGSRFLEYNKQKYELIPVSMRSANIGALDLHDVQSIVHFAGKAHEMSAIDDSIYFEINYDLTKQLADRAKAQGVSQFIFISSVKVYGEESEEVLTESSGCTPEDAYGKSKLQAENYLRSIQSDTFRVAIVRPPLVYGPHVKGNMIRFLKLAEKNIPLPFGNMDNKRSMVFIDNLVELINRIIERRASGTFVAGDREPLSTEYLMRQMRTSMGKKQKLIGIPGIVKGLLKKVRPSLYKRLFQSFVISNEATNTTLNFNPPYSSDYGIEQMVKWYEKSDKR